MKSFRMFPPAAGIAAVMLALCGGTVQAQTRHDRDRYRDRGRDAEDCHFYAREQAYRYAPPGAGALSGAARGAAKGAVFGAIVGGEKGARRGAAAAGAMGLIASGARNQADRDHAYRRAYDDCMDGYRR
jgi:hypothetical protein